MKSAECDVRTSLLRSFSHISLRDVCRSLTQLIDSCGNQKLEYVFKEIMDEITVNKPVKWGLKQENFPPEDSLHVRELLGLQGPFFRLIYRMMAHGTQCVLTGSYISEYHEGSNHMSAFEAYFVHFARFITETPTFVDSVSSQYSLRNTSVQGDVSDTPYFILLDEYFTHFFPMSSDVKSPAINLGMPLKSSPKPHRTFAKSSLLLPPNSTKMTCHGETLCCDVLTQLFSKIWLEEYFNKIGGNMEKKLPTQNHVRAVRLFVKHIHYFYNSHAENIRHLRSDSPWEQVNPNIMNNFAPKLYDFLLHCFEIWPREHTLRIVLETWLSFIQPWRYVKIGQGIASDAAVGNDWYSFVYQHRRFYSALFQVAIRKFKCMDLSTVGNSLLLFRVAKVFKQRNLITLIDQAQEVSLQEMSRSYGSYLISPATKTALDDNMFSMEFTEVVKRLMDMMSQALEAVKFTKNAEVNSDFSTKALQFFGYGALLDSHSGSESVSERKKAQQNLEYAMAFFADTYDLPIPTAATSRPASPIGKLEIADHTVNEHGRVTLSPAGRYQLQNNLRKFPIALNTDPEHWPICSYESAFLVRLLYSISSKVNKKYQYEMDSMCRRRNFVGKLSRHLLVPSRFNAASDYLKPRLSLRFLAHYRNMFYTLLLYMFAWLFGFSFPVSLIYILCFIAVLVIIQVLFSAET